MLYNIIYKTLYIIYNYIYKIFISVLIIQILTHAQREKRKIINPNINTILSRYKY